MPVAAEGDMDEACACREKTGGGGEAMRTAWLMVLDAGNSSGEKKAAREAAVKHFCKWKGRLKREGPKGEGRQKRWATWN